MLYCTMASCLGTGNKAIDATCVYVYEVVLNTTAYAANCMPIIRG